MIFSLIKSCPTKDKVLNSESENTVPFRKVKKKHRKSVRIYDKGSVFQELPLYNHFLLKGGFVKKVFYILICAVVCTFVTIPSYASGNGVLVGNYGDWSVYTLVLVIVSHSEAPCKELKTMI